MKLDNIKKLSFLFLSATIIFFVGCGKDDDPDPQPEETQIKLNFDFYNNNEPIKYGTLDYTNDLGSEYLVYEIKYFISRVTVYKGGEAKELSGFKKIHYINSLIPSTLSWTIVDEIEAGTYDSLSFTFGFNDEDNESFMYTDAPENEMVWPEFMGGGYHYMKLEGKWKTPDDFLSGMAIHLGIGQIYDTTGNITEYIDNSFRVSIPNSNFTVTDQKTTNLTLRMNVEEWFRNPTVYDFDHFGGAIMDKQDAMSTLCKNGWNVFSIVK